MEVLNKPETEKGKADVSTAGERPPKVSTRGRKDGKPATRGGGVEKPIFTPGEVLKGKNRPRSQ